MYQFSRAIYRELARDIQAQPVSGDGSANHAYVLGAAEAAVRRLATDRHYFARPGRTLFNDIRFCFPMSAQARVHRVVETYLQQCVEWLDEQPPTGYDLLGNKLECRATTRKGTPCRRMPLPRNGYCPSHQHLAELDERETAGLPVAA